MIGKKYKKEKEKNEESKRKRRKKNSGISVLYSPLFKMESLENFYL